MNKEECLKRLKEARYTIQPYSYVNEAIDYAIKLINEHSELVESLNTQSVVSTLTRDIKRLEKRIESLTDNPPLKFEELHEGMWVWDNKWKTYKQIHHLSNRKEWSGFALSYTDWICFEENRYFRHEVKEVEE